MVLSCILLDGKFTSTPCPTIIFSSIFQLKIKSNVIICNLNSREKQFSFLELTFLTKVEKAILNAAGTVGENLTELKKATEIDEMMAYRVFLFLVHLENSQLKILG